MGRSSRREKENPQSRGRRLIIKIQGGTAARTPKKANNYQRSGMYKLGREECKRKKKRDSYSRIWEPQLREGGKGL